MYTLEDAARDGWKGEQAEKWVIWRNKVAQEITKKSGIDIDDMGDWYYADAFEGGMSAEEAATEALEFNGFPL